MKLSQCDVILKAMLQEKDRVVWTAKDFQKGKYFVGYEASARMSDLISMYPNMLIVGKDGRFRTLSIDWDCKDEIIEKLKEYELI